MNTESLDDRLDALVAQYAERLSQGLSPDPEALLSQVPEGARGELARCLRLIEVGRGRGALAPVPIGPGTVFDGLRLERELGRGGMAVVYLATQLDLARPVAVKVLRPGLALDERHVERFRREALAIARLSHPHIVQIHGVGTGLGHPYLAMEYVEGPTLAEVYAKLPPAGERTALDLARLVGWPAERVLGRSFEAALAELLAPAARALATAHEVGLVHRDVKPSNILIRKNGGAVVADFGLAKGDGDLGLSLSGEPLGTPFYMSPEQATMVEARVDRRTDVYSFGVVLYEGIAGVRPFTGQTFVEVLDAVRHRETEPLRARDKRASANAQALVRRAMAREREGRYPSALELAVDLGALAEGRATQAHAQSGTGLRRMLAGVAAVNRGDVAEYKSDLVLLGLPLLCVRSSQRVPGKGLTARGWIAIGPRAVGGLAFGGMAAGGVAFGGLSFGLFSIGGLCAGLLAWGGIAVGGLAVGGGAAGYVAIGGFAMGQHAFGGETFGAHAVGPERRDPEALAFFRANRWIFHLLPGGADAMDRARLDEP